MMRSIHGLWLLVLLVWFALTNLTGEEPLTKTTDFHVVTPNQVLTILHNANQIHLSKIPVKGDTPFSRYDVDACSGRKKPYNRLESYCENIFIDNNIDNATVLLFDMQALFRGCGLYAPSPADTVGGRTCGLLGRLFYAIGNTAAARTVWDKAPGCHAPGPSGPTNGCMQFIIGRTCPGGCLHSKQVNLEPIGKDGKDAYLADQQTLLSMARQACYNEVDFSSCVYLTHYGEQFDFASIDQSLSARERAYSEQRDPYGTSAAEGSGTSTLILQSLQDSNVSSGSNAILDTGNQQAEQLRAIGDANAAAQRRAAEERIQAQQQAEQERLAQQQAAEQAAQQQQAQQQAQQQSVTVSEGELIKSPNSPNVYVVQGGQLHLIPDPATLQSQWSWSQVQTVPQSTIDGMPVGGVIPAVASQNCTNMDSWVSGTVKVASDGFVVGHLTNNSNQVLYVSYTFAQGGMPSRSSGVGGGVTIQPGQTVGGEGGGIWTTGNTVDTNPPHIYWHAVLQSDVDAGKVCPSEW